MTRFALRRIFGVFPLKTWLLVAVFAVAAIGAGWAAYQHQKARADRAEARLAPAVATGKALDRVATQTPIIRAEQEEKSRAVDDIQGADQRLPDGFGADLERVRRGGRDRHPR